MGKFAYVIVLSVAALLLFGCVSQPTNPPPPPYPSVPAGSDVDSHGCIGSAGYIWCAEKSKCLRTWEENCSSLAGGDIDEHGCIASAGYSWCAEKSKCLRVWVEACNATDRMANALEHCADGNVSQVSVCGQYVKVASSLLGGGSIFYSDNGTSTACPLVAPEEMSEQCSLLMAGSNCEEQIADCRDSNPPEAVSDLQDDSRFIGAQLTWSQPFFGPKTDPRAVDYEVFRSDENFQTISLIAITNQTSFNEVFDGNNTAFAYFVRARNALGAESPVSNIVYVVQPQKIEVPSPE